MEVAITVKKVNKKRELVKKVKTLIPLVRNLVLVVQDSSRLIKIITQIKINFISL